ncbi:MAG: filamentous hemagglutinin N-terminal domain-containing protein [Limnohabitans sp.]|uniref:two-partner secretion domain-containing protein n=1 Tax=Limnohabitans sp. TaxID=1907725 RepID=UPI0025FB5D6A|nr:filamentous hemagglutinin N-terminal domain-containing protein [Limnohabitans sp.]MCO4088407.1 filamentous hemagglutinin N-terminal domain-containing protein [Limnohabitans sp.]
MNRTYRLVWSVRLAGWIAASEICRGHVKASSTVRCAAVVAGLSLALNALALAPGELPSGGQLSAGQARIQAAGTTMTVHQDTAKVAIDWQSFNIGNQAAVSFNQPAASAIALNRVLGQDASQIMGRLTSNGQVFLLNPNGVLFGSTAQVNVGGMVASTLGMSNDDLMAGNHRFSGSSTAAVTNQGRITAGDGGYVALLATQAKNEGVIQARMGHVALAAGSDVTLNLNNGSLLGLTVHQGAVSALAQNSHLIQAEGGKVLMTAQAADRLVSAVVNNSGIIEARGVRAEDGVIRLVGDSSAGIVTNTGTLKAGTVQGQARSVLQAGAIEANSVNLGASYALVQTQDARIRAEGGDIRLDGGQHTYLSGTLDASGGTSTAAGGNITVAGPSITLSAASLDASATSAGGTAGSIRVGGGAHGLDTDMTNAQTVTVSGATSLRADGQRGQIVVWSDDATHYFGKAKAGDQGFIEISSKDTLNLGGTTEVGAGGQILYDPTNIVIDAVAPTYFYLDLADPTPTAGDQHGSSGATQLTNGNMVVTSSQDNFGASKSGAAYLYHGTTGALISALYGSTANDQVGSGGITALSNGNYVVSSNLWDNTATATDAGAVTWGSGTAGISGAVSAANSLVGSTASDSVGSGGITALSNGNYVVRSSNWRNGAGAVTWGSGTTGISGAVSATNSLVGSRTSDQVGSGGITALSNGNYVVSSSSWGNGAIGNAGAVTWGSGTTGVSGAVSATNSLVGSTASDSVGSGGITALSNGNYVVSSSSWDNRTIGNAGAVTWGSGTGGTIGAVSATNSLVGSRTSDQVGSGGITALTNGNYVVRSSNWRNGPATTRAGAVTWGSGTAGVSGVVSAANSLVGSKVDDQVGNGGITALSNGNYVVSSSSWDKGPIANAGAVTWGNGTTGISGAVSATNSLVGSKDSDQVGGGGITALSNGNYVVRSSNWAQGVGVFNLGAVTWGNGTGGVSGEVSATNSLVGSTAEDRVGNDGITALSNGNYVVRSSNWRNGENANAGAVTWGSGTAGISGAVSATNSLVGSTAEDRVGNDGITALSNGNYVVRSRLWNNGAATRAGAVTWGNGTGGTMGAVSATNSLVGSKVDDQVGGVGSGGITALSNGNYVVRSSSWDNTAAAAADAGAVTWGSGTAGISGAVSAANSLVGSKRDDNVGSGGITALSNGNYVVSSSAWGNGTNANAGAVTWGSGTAGVSGVVSAANSLVGSRANDQVGSGGITALTNGNYVVRSPNFDGQRGAVWLVADPASAAEMINASSGTANVNPALLANAAGAGTTVTLQATNDITVNSAVNVAGKLNLLAGNRMTLNAGGTITSTAPGDALVLSGNTFVNNAGSNALTAANGRWLVYSNAPAGNTFGGLASGNNAVWNATHAGNAPATIASGNRYVFAQQPTVAITANAQTKVYDGWVARQLNSCNADEVVGRAAQEPTADDC